MASSIPTIECSICLEEYNDTNKRPRTLPCAHKFCSTCLQNHIEKGRKICCICRKLFRATKVEDIPIDTDVEKLLQLYAAMLLKSSKENEQSDEEEFSKGHCSKHKKSVLYFKCTSHSVYVCRECTVLDHFPSRCNIIEIKEEVMEKKRGVINQAKLTIVNLDSTRISLECIGEKKDKIIVSMQKQVEDVLRKIEEERKVRDEIKKKLNENIMFKKQIEGILGDLQEATTEKNINKRISDILNETTKLDSYLKEPTKYGTPLKIESLKSFAGHQVIVYLDLGACGKLIGRLRILLTCGPKRQVHMVNTCSGREGNTFKGSWIDKAEYVEAAGESIELNGYMTSGGNRDNRVSVEDMNQRWINPYTAGLVTGYSDNANLVICTKSQLSYKKRLEIGRVLSSLEVLSQAIQRHMTHCGIWGGIKIVDSGVELPA